MISSQTSKLIFISEVKDKLLAKVWFKNIVYSGVAFFNNVLQMAKSGH